MIVVRLPRQLFWANPFNPRAPRVIVIMELKRLFRPMAHTVARRQWLRTPRPPCP